MAEWRGIQRMRLAVIPARGGSKRIPQKNIREFSGKPIIAWSIEAVLKSGCFDRVVVSTDDQEISEVARHWGAEVPFVRPDGLSGDYVGIIPVIKHAIEWFGEQGIHFKEVCCIYATAPSITADDIKKGLDILHARQCDFALAITSFSFPIQRAVKISSNGYLEMFQPEQFNTRSQDLDPAYHDTGQFCWGTSTAWKDDLPFFNHSVAPVILPSYRVQDIDTPEDWTRAELMFKVLKSTESFVPDKE